MVGDDYQDRGVGAFDSLIDQALPEIHEDVTYREEQERIAEEIEHEQHEAENKGGLLSMLGARFSSVDTGLDTHVDYKLSELPITFPSQWAAADYLARERMVGRARRVRARKVLKNAALRDLSCLQR